ncbi:MAG: toxin-antitoxin system TumE family protein [Bacillota bacterium]
MPLDLDRLFALYDDIIKKAELVGIGTASKIRITFKDASYLDIWFSESGRYSYHWERRHIDGKVFRFDNAPHHVGVNTYPHHVHDGAEDKVTNSWISHDPGQAIFQVLGFIRRELDKTEI